MSRLAFASFWGSIVDPLQAIIGNKNLWRKCHSAPSVRTRLHSVRKRPFVSQKYLWLSFRLEYGERCVFLCSFSLRFRQTWCGGPIRSLTHTNSIFCSCGQYFFWALKSGENHWPGNPSWFAIWRRPEVFLSRPKTSYAYAYVKVNPVCLVLVWAGLCFTDCTHFNVVYHVWQMTYSSPLFPDFGPRSASVGQSQPNRIV